MPIALAAVLLYTLFAILFRVLLPLGDEPDWLIRAPRVVYGNFSIFSPYYYFSLLSSISTLDPRHCFIDASAFSLWGYISEGCVEPVGQLFSRFLFTLLLMSPLLAANALRSACFPLACSFGFPADEVEWTRRLDAISVVLVFPGMIYSLGVLAEEQLFLVICLWLFIFWRVWKIMLVLFLVLIYIDVGNSIVVAFSIFSFYFLFFIFEKFGRRMLFAVTSVCLALSLVSGILFFDFFMSLSVDLGLTSFSGKFGAISEAYLTQSNAAKYPIALRPVITAMTAVFSSPSGLKSVAAFIFLGFLAFNFSRVTKFRRDFFLDADWVYLIFPFFVVLFLVFILPTYSNAKYYVFLLPFCAYAIIPSVDRSRFFLSSASLSIIVLLNLILFRIDFS